MGINNSKCRKPAAALLAAATALGITLTPKPVDSYATGSMENPSVHQFLVDKLTAFHPSAKYDVAAIKRGTVNEDSPNNSYKRAFHHFQHWQTGEGIYGFAPVKEWAMNGNLQKDSPFGDHSWNKVQEEYGNGKIGESFGFVSHLITDLTVPAHTRLDPHPFSSSAYKEKLTEGLWPADFYEVWTHENRNKIKDAVQPKEAPAFASLEDLLDNLAFFTGSNFYSDTKVDGSVDCNWEGKYCLRDVEGQKVRVLRQGFLRKFPDRACLEDSWKILGRKAVEYGTAAVGLLEGSSGSCTSHASKVCSNGDVYWEDSCGALEDKIKDCTGTEKCENGECVGDSCNPANGGGSNSVFYDSFNGSSLDTECRWDESGGSPYVSNGKLNLKSGDSLATKKNFECQNKDFTFEFNIKVANDSGLTTMLLGKSLGLGIELYSNSMKYGCGYGDDFNKINLDLTSYTSIKLQKQGNSLILYINNTKKDYINNTKDYAYCSSNNITHISIGTFNGVNVDSVNVKCF